jgi:pentatricopeptide repeat protein
MREVGIRSDIPHYDMVSRACEKTGDAKPVLKILLLMREDEVPCTIVVYNLLISACAKARKVETALEVYAQMQADGLQPDIVACNMLISTCVRCGRPEKALEIFDKILDETNVHPNVFTYSTAITASEQKGLFAKSEVILQHAVAGGVFLPALGYSVQTSTLNFQSNAIWAAAEKYGHTTDVSPTVACALCRHHQHRFDATTKFIVGGDAVKQAIQECMRDVGMNLVDQRNKDGSTNPGVLVPSPDGASSGRSANPGGRRTGSVPGPMQPARVQKEGAKNQQICDRFSNDKDHEQYSAEDVLKVTTSVIASCTVEQGLECLQAMRRVGVQPRIHQYNALAQLCDRNRDAKNALEILAQMAGDGVPRSLLVYNMLISACAKATQPGDALKIDAQMRQDGFQPDIVVRSMLISTCARGGMTEEALQIFDQMLAEKIELDVVAYGSAFTACEISGQGERALEIFALMRTRNVEPDIVIYNTLISVLGKSGMADKAREVFALMPTGKARVLPDAITYNAVISAFEKAGQAKQALEVFDLMLVDENVEPDAIAYKTLIMACEQEGLFAKSEEILHHAVSHGVFLQGLGYSEEANTLNFHSNSVLAVAEEDEHEACVPAVVAQALFRHHRKKFNAATEFVVGQHGDDLVKQAIWQCMQEEGMNPVDLRNRDGSTNPGRLVSSSAGGTRAAKPVDRASRSRPSARASGARRPPKPGARGFGPRGPKK